MNKLSKLGKNLLNLRQKANLEQSDMKMLIGMSQQQYQRIESGSDTRLSTLFRILDGLGVSMMLVPNDKVKEVKAILSGDAPNNTVSQQGDDWSSIIDDLED